VQIRICADGGCKFCEHAAGSIDAKGPYKKARSGQLPNLTGVGSPYEAPARADVVLDCSDAPLGVGVKKLIDAIEF